MSAGAIEGVVKNGSIHLRGNVSLPENTKVLVVVAESHEATSARVATPRLAHPEQMDDFRKQVVELGPDAKL